MMTLGALVHAADRGRRQGAVALGGHRNTDGSVHRTRLPAGQARGWSRRRCRSAAAARPAASCRCETEADVDAALKRLLGTAIKGHEVRSCLVEAAVAGADEYYLSLMLDPAQYGVRVMLLREGGVDVEQSAAAASAQPALRAGRTRPLPKRSRELAAQRARAIAARR